jgi:ParB/RepB/Spo0J family partition protein
MNEEVNMNLKPIVRGTDLGSSFAPGGTKTDNDALPTDRSKSGSIKTRRDHSIIQIELSSICKESPFQTRQELFDPKTFPEDEELLESVRVNGVLEPIMVFANPYHTGSRLYQTVFGHRRVAAARLVGFEEITALVIHDEDEARFLTIAENMGNRGLTPYEKALALVRLKETYPSFSTRDLERETGIPFQSVSTLIRAYQESPPTLRKMFAEGLAPGAVLQLKPVFETIPESERKRLAKALQGLSRRQAQGIRVLVDRGATPYDAIKILLGSEANQRLSPIRSPTSASIGEKQENKTVKRKSPTPLPAIGDKTYVNKLAEFTGASKAKVNRLLEQAIGENESKEVLVLACAYAANRGEEETAIQYAKLVYEDYELYKLLNRYLTLKRRVRRQVQELQNQTKVDFTNRIVFGK